MIKLIYNKFWFLINVFTLCLCLSWIDANNVTYETNHTWPSTNIVNNKQRPLSNYILHHEPLSYNYQTVHKRAKRSANDHKNNYLYSSKKPSLVHIDFFAHGKHFKLRLFPDTESVFSKDIKIESSDGQALDVNLDHIYSGYLENDHLSKVYGHIINGVFEGKIHSQNGTYYIERSHRYPKIKGKNVHSVIYNSDDVVYPDSDKFEGGCMDEKIKQWMDTISNSAVPLESDKLIKIRKLDTDLNDLKYDFDQSLFDEGNKTRHKRQSDYFSDSILNDFKYHTYSHSYFPYSKGFYDLQQRISELSRNPSKVFNSHTTHNKNRACSLYIQTDTFLWNHIRKEAHSEFKAREEISSLVAQHIKAVNHIYENTDFNGIRGLKFIVQRLKINDSTACNITNKHSNPFCSPNIDVSNFLNLNSQFNHDDFCLAYIFTYRDFSGGTLGLAWVASTSGASGGICEKYKSYTENINNKQVQTKRSLNTGIITFVNYLSSVPPKVSELTLAHEIGHNFGSPHDFPMECRPGGVSGNYIMYSSATSGERLNNNKFSPCSMRNISSVLSAVFNEEGKINCFQEDQGPFCGNKIVEENEECDCGYDFDECTEKCCFPREVASFPNTKGCTRRQGSCSPSEGPCCNEMCGFEPSTKQCRAKSECTYESFCTGKSAQCPHPIPKSNKTECNSGTQVCVNGLCVGSICLKYDLEECFLTSKKGAKLSEMCEVACQQGNDVSTCKRTSEIESMKSISGLKLRPGSPCNDYQGYCDIFQKCRAVDAEGPLASLKNLLLNHKTYFKQWATKNWWACIVMGMSIILLMAAFIKCCAVHTPSSNPKKKPAVRISDTFRHPADTLRRKRHRAGHSSSRHQSGHRHSSQNNSSGHSNNSSNIILQPSAPPLPSHIQPQVYQQTQLVVALPPESTITFTSTSNRMNEPPPPYPGYTPTSSGLSVANSNSNSVPPPLPPPRPSSLVTNNIINVNSNNGGSVHSATSSTSSKNNLLPSRGYGEGRGHYNRKGQCNVPTKSKSSSNSNNGSNAKASSSASNSHKNPAKNKNKK